MTLSITQGDITKLAVDAIFNAANSSLLGGGGVDGAIHRAAGPRLLAECQEIRARQGGGAPGDAVITSGAKLLARHVIHTVGPVWQGGRAGEVEILKRCYASSLKLAHEHQVTSIAFPNISTGVYGFPKELAAQSVYDYFRLYLDSPPAGGVRELIFVCHDEENFRLYKALFDTLSR